MNETLQLIAVIAAPGIIASIVWAGMSYQPLQKAVATCCLVVSVAATFLFLGLETSGGLDPFLDQYRF